MIVKIKHWMLDVFVFAEISLLLVHFHRQSKEMYVCVLAPEYTYIFIKIFICNYLYIRSLLIKVKNESEKAG